MAKFIDEAIIEVTSGDGGNGLVAWRREKYEPMGGPAGGDGGKGGDIIFVASPNFTSLYDFTYKSSFVAKAGYRGGPKKRHGANASNLLIPVPLGTVITDLDSNEIIADLIYPNQQIVVASGGLGGYGNASIATMLNKAPHYCEPGRPGTTLNLKLELKTLADIGIIGLPNAGKSSLLAKLSNAKPKIASYPFSTLTPNLGVGHGNLKITFADIPGLIKGASSGHGLGLQFLKHIERTACLIQVIDISSPDLFTNICDLEFELLAYSPNFKHKKNILVLNKIDLLDESVCVFDLIKDLQLQLNKVKSKLLTHHKILAISALNSIGLAELQSEINGLMDVPQVFDQEILEYNQYKPTAHKDKNDKHFVIYQNGGQYYVEGDFINRYLSVTNLRDPESVQHFSYILKKYGVMAKIMELRLKPGTPIIINNLTFKYLEDLF